MKQNILKAATSNNHAEKERSKERIASKEIQNSVKYIQSKVTVSLVKKNKKHFEGTTLFALTLWSLSYFARKYQTILRSWDSASQFYVNKCPTRCNYTQFILSVNYSNCFGLFLHPSSGAQITVSTASGTSQPLLLTVAIHDSNR